MIECPNCHHSEFAGALFCSECGARLAVQPPLDVSMSSGEDDTRTIPTMATERPGDSPTEQSTIPLAKSSQAPIAQVVLQLVGTGERIPLEGGPEFTLGRVSQGQPLIPEIDLAPYAGYQQGVSRLHAVIGVQGAEVSITDLGSANGTRINQKKIPPHSPHPLQDGDQVMLGKLVFKTSIQSNV